ncbi:hypothetical protein C8R45DRAFT_314374 [Mycena sanguinolenta]|nr:hypothetical protein C8R45DRAFT_314374 [Mycena sanguinolenta]
MIARAAKAKGWGANTSNLQHPLKSRLSSRKLDIGLNATNEPRLPLAAKRLLVKSLSSCTLYSALDAATADSECDQVVEKVKSEWVNAGRWVLALATIYMSLFAIDSQSLLGINSFSRKAVATSSIATFLGLVCDAWLLGRYYSLHTREFMSQARDIYGSYAFFALSARLPSLAVLISILALGAFVVCVVYQTLPALTIVLGSIFLIVMVLQFIIRGSEVFYCSIAEALSAVVRWIQELRAKTRGVAGGAHNDSPTTAGERAGQRRSS